MGLNFKLLQFTKNGSCLQQLYGSKTDRRVALPAGHMSPRDSGGLGFNLLFGKLVAQNYIKLKEIGPTTHPL